MAVAAISSDAYGWDSILLMKPSSFFTDLLSKKAHIQPLRSSEYHFVSPKHKFLKTRRCQFFIHEGKLKIHFNGSGLIYQLEDPRDSIYKFKRIDLTENINYNIEAFLFTHQNDIYNIGGYGYWRSSGTLRKYNQKDREWDAVPIDEEVHIPYVNQLGTAGILSWFNIQTQHLYIPFQTEINGGLKGNDEKDLNIKEVYLLDLKTKDWEKLGKTNKNYYEILQKTKWVLPTDVGQLICFNHKVYHVDFEKNEIKESNDPALAQSLERINNTHLAYYNGEKIYYLDGYTWKYDSVKVDTSKFEKADFKVWKKNNTGFAIGIAPVFIIIAATAARKRRAKETRNKILTAASTGTPISTVAKIKFNETEKQLLNLLLEKSKNNSTTTITEINYVLGIKDKNVGLQKKVRSDVMKSINEKFNFLQDGDTELVCNIRSQADKRFFEYYIEEANIALLEIMLKEENE